MPVDRRYRRTRRRSTRTDMRTPTPLYHNNFDENPNFRVISFDGLFWLHPYSGSPIPLNNRSWREVAYEALSSEKPSAGHEPMALFKLYRTRWSMWLRDNIRNRPELCTCDKSGFWINPITGMPSPTLQLHGGIIDSTVVSRIADELARIPGSNPNQFRVIERVARPSTKPDRNDRKATQVQENFLRPLPDTPDWEWGRLFEPLEDVGGDFVEVLKINENKILIALGDVSGHGTQGALISVAASKSLRHLANQHSSIGDLAISFNNDLKADLLPGQFLTCWLGLLNPASGMLEHISLGHEAPLVFDPNGPVYVRRLLGKGPGIGLLKQERFAAQLKLSVTTLKEGGIFIYTDGLTEMGEGSESGEFGFERVAANGMLNSQMPPEAFVKALALAADKHANKKRDDDLSMLAFRRIHPDEASDDLETIS